MIIMQDIFRLQAARHRPERPGLRPVRGDGRAAVVRQPPGSRRHQAAVEFVPGARVAARLDKGPVWQPASFPRRASERRNRLAPGHHDTIEWSDAMTPLMISVLAFLGVSGLIGVLAFVFRDDDAQGGRRGWTCSIGKRRKKDDETGGHPAQDRLRERQEIAPGGVHAQVSASLQKMFEQADCHIKPQHAVRHRLAAWRSLGVTVTLAGAACRGLRADQRPGHVLAAVGCGC